MRTACSLCRRALLLGALGAACKPASPHAAETAAARAAPPAPGDSLVLAEPGASLRPVGPADVRPHAPPVRAWPMVPGSGLIRNGTRFNQILLIWSGSEGSGRIAAYSAICTHAGCIVSGWSQDGRLLLCPCHGSAYAADHDGAVFRGPAARPLPALQVKTVDGVLIVASPFDGRIGGDTSRTM